MLVHSDTSTGLGQPSAMVLTEKLAKLDMECIKNNNYFHPFNENK
jgi:hypothetical protein